MGVHDGRAWFLADHLSRLQAAGVGWSATWGDGLSLRDLWQRLVTQAIEMNRLTRGVLRVGAEWGPRSARPFVLCSAARTTPQRVVIQIVESGRPAEPGPSKSTMHLRWESYRRQAAQSDCFDVLLAHRGRLLEASRANLFLDLGGVFATPPEGQTFAGIARAALLRCHEVKAIERPLSVGDLVCARQVLLTNSVRGIIPVAAVRDVSGHVIWQGDKQRAVPLVRIFSAKAGG